MFIKTTFISVAALAISMGASAADPLHNTKWQTIDDESKKPKAIIKITEVNGKLQGVIEKYMVGGACKLCKGKYKNKSLVGAKIFWDLKPVGNAKYSAGKIYDPKKDKAYKLKGKLTRNGKTLEMRGYIGSPLLGRTQKWNRIK